MRTRFRGITVREGLLLEGPAGWGEFSPFLDYDAPVAAPWLLAAREAAYEPWPEAVRDTVPVNVTVPATGPGRAHRIVTDGGCRTAKVKVAEPGQSLGDDLARVEAVRDALGPGGRVRVDANGGWDVEAAVEAVRALDRAAGGLEYVEQPCASVEDLAAVRRAVDVPVAADESIRRAEDPYRVRDLGAADVARAGELGRDRRRRRPGRRAAGAALRLRAGHRPAPHRRPRRRPPAAGARRPAGAPPGPRPGGAGAAGRGPGATRGLGAAAGRGRGARVSAPGASDATQLARAVLTRLLDAGVEHLVLCPGSRSAPLAFAAYDAERAGRLRLHTRVDERTAAFLALGLAKGSHRPVPVLCTSGTAAASFHPAVLEAAHAGVPLVALTADRPASLRGTGANQTTEQVGLYAGAAATLDVAAVADLDALVVHEDAPTHLNVQLAEPLVPDALGWSPPTPSPTLDPRERPDRAEKEEEIALGPRTVVVAGDDAGPAARRLAERAGWPLLAEPSSGSRTGENAIRTYRLLLGTELGEQVQRVVVLGHPTLSRPVTRLLARDDVEVVSVRARGRWPRRPHPVAREVGPEVRLVPTGPDDPAWLAQWRERDADVVRRLDALVDEQGLGPHAVAREVGLALAPGDQLVVGASNPVRDLDLVGPAHPVGERRKVLANRGLAGIDGTISTAIGVALTRPGAQTYALLGDVTFLHDAGALVLGPDEPRPDLAVVVVNDDGGSIFAGLEQGAADYAPAFERLFGTPHGTDLAALCAATRTPHWRVESLPELRQALASPNGGVEVVEARVGRADRRELDARVRALVE
ncbi:hypothetical protein LUZ63_020305 [Rhynchospora breviuscula]|uniref:Mandelate racemase/muconate lactonizing enzyme C-terminal domain-containing protein n=1 Tax=Rhynchospora breviuscula TaxID=2022672 RepID=A0A9P9Z8Y8_9POAL|nr:hypothetical protein LUZ63_020305 [Rhynchospora breviuscula]